MERHGTKINKTKPNIYSCAILFCTTALFEAIFLGLAIEVLDIRSLSIHLGLVFALQITAYLKAICIWHIHRYLTRFTGYITCAAAAALMMYLIIEVFTYLVKIFSPDTLMSLNAIAIASADGLLSVALLYGIRRWLKVILENEPLQLSSQIRHHFLFNTLNATVCRIKENPDLAQDNLEKLADLFRKILFLKIYISLEEELASVKCYLGIEKYRLGKRLHVSWLLDYRTYAVIKVPALILQPLVENAVYHGIEKIAGGGTVAISLRTVKNRLIIQVCNPIANDGYFGVSRSNYVAQANIERRLALAYGDNFSFKRERCEKEYRATINLPIGGLLQ